MAVPEEEVAQVRTATDIVALIGEHVALRKQGRRFTGLCPFHAEKTPSFSVNPELGFYYCFGCQQSGDAIDFVRSTEHLDFLDAIRFLAERAGITLHEDAGTNQGRQQRNEFFEAMDRAVAWYHDRLLTAPDAGPARQYLRSRGYDGEVVRNFRLGWAPEGWDTLTRALGLSERVLNGTGLGFVNRRGRRQDAFRGRIIFPICDPGGRPIALGGRILPGRAESGGVPEPKYKNSAETAIYSKRRTLYALNWAKHDVVAKGEVLVCEGYTDVIGLFTAGLPRAVATCGTALGEEHFTVLRNFAKRIVLAYDADQAGQSGVTRVYEWERRHEVEVAVAALPEGSDPGELAQRDPEALREAVAGARPLLQFRVDRVFAGAQAETVEGRARAAEAALEAVAEHPDDLVRDQYVMQVADRCRMEPARLRERLEELRRRPRPADDGPGNRRRRADERVPNRPDDAAPPTTAEAPPEVIEPGGHSSPPGLEALRLAVHRPGLVADRLEEVLFVDEVQRGAFHCLTESDTLQEAVESAPPDAAALLRRVSVEEPVVVEAPLADPVDAVITQLVREAAGRVRAELQAMLRSGSADFALVSEEDARVGRDLQKLDDPEVGREASDRLVAWLLARRQEA